MHRMYNSMLIAICDHVMGLYGVFPLAPFTVPKVTVLVPKDKKNTFLNAPSVDFYIFMY